MQVFEVVFSVIITMEVLTTDLSAQWVPMRIQVGYLDGQISGPLPADLTSSKGNGLASVAIEEDSKMVKPNPEETLNYGVL